MERIAFTMQLKSGVKDEYKKRHDEIWPEMVAVLKEAGVSDYSIFLDEETGKLFAVLCRQDGHGMDDLPNKEIVRKWWEWNAPLMDVQPDNEPVSKPLEEMFYLP
ncbi:L-rhamnose mutarotase [uncultured Cohaesibacter sp.]|uniref:L-rhamnose mutarotase n=1 Tax=uncultured Cohaesibacter sp. TaxID=1002546 RepID=UPI00292E9A23|nr:L-rhamnose mutarotase [uncultured Cohaesibacter sp.]